MRKLFKLDESNRAQNTRLWLEGDVDCSFSLALCSPPIERPEIRSALAWPPYRGSPIRAIEVEEREFSSVLEPRPAIRVGAVARSGVCGCPQRHLVTGGRVMQGAPRGPAGRLAFFEKAF